MKPPHIQGFHIGPVICCRSHVSDGCLRERQSFGGRLTPRPWLTNSWLLRSLAFRAWAGFARLLDDVDDDNNEKDKMIPIVIVIIVKSVKPIIAINGNHNMNNNNHNNHQIYSNKDNEHNNTKYTELQRRIMMILTINTMLPPTRVMTPHCLAGSESSDAEEPCCKP